MMTTEELIEEIEDLIESLDEHVTQDDISRTLDDLRVRIKTDGIEGRAHARAMVDVNAEDRCSDMECDHEDGCPTVKMAVCLGCSSEEPNDDGVIFYLKWEMAEWKHHAETFSPHTEDCVHGDQRRDPVTPPTAGSTT